MEIMQFAIAMEKDGEAYYREQAARNAGNALRVVFELLAKDEARHAQLLQNMQDDVAYELESDNALTKQISLFRGTEDFQSAVRELPDQAELYHAASEKERQSIELYGDLKNKAADGVSRELFGFLLREEQKHFTLLDELFRHVNRPKEWVEAAEFGVREEY
jgi:rubrerythrin